MNLHFNEVRYILKKCHFLKIRWALYTLLYYIGALLTTALDGISLIVLLDLIIHGFDGNTDSVYLQAIVAGLKELSIEPTFLSIYWVIIGGFFAKSLMSWFVSAFEGSFLAIARRNIQNQAFDSALQGDWEILRTMVVGQYVGTITEEATNTAKFFLAFIRAIYGAIGLSFYLFLACSISIQATLIMAFVGLPCLLLLRYIFKVQAGFSDKFVIERQAFYSDITERLHSLFQIKVEGSIDYHVEKGLQHQNKMTNHEFAVAYLQAAVSSFNGFMPAIVLAAFSLLAYWTGASLTNFTYILAGMGVIGSRILSQANIFAANYGNMVTFSASIAPVYKVLAISRAFHKELIQKKIHTVRLSEVEYAFSNSSLIPYPNLTLNIGRPFFIFGASGSGKTTLANLISGVYNPSQGEIFYIDENNREYSSFRYKPKVGYVTQDIQLFRGSIRENLLSYNEHADDDMLWKYLQQAGAEVFIKNLGGLDALISESGRSLSGGERRRLGIARVLAAEPDVLLLDEVTVGLDHEKKAELLVTIDKLAEELVVVVITHDAMEIDNDYIIMGK